MGGAKKSVYIFMCSVMGVLLFVILHRLIVLAYLTLLAYGVFHWTSSYSYFTFVAVDYITLLLAMFCGSWYGIWLGEYWYEKIYETGEWRGVTRHLHHKLFPQRPTSNELKARVEVVKLELAEDLSRIQQSIEDMPREILMETPIKRRAVKRKPAVKRKTTKTKTL